jgi:putative N6-adenine-specific DNA methylase
LLSIRRFSAVNQAMLYDQVRRIDWPSFFSADKSMAVFAHGLVGEGDYKLSFAPLKIKDAVCDEFRKRVNVRPSVDRKNPRVRIEAFFFNQQCELSIDLSGEPLHRRGYREEGAEAPLRENRAAALLAFAGYDGSRPLVDPFCGSGTIVIEAGLIATRRAPGLLRSVQRFALAELFPEAKADIEAVRREAQAAVLSAPSQPIEGRDVSDETLAIARSNAVKAGLKGLVSFRKADAREIEAPDSLIVTNPPYGERLENPEAAAGLVREFTHRVKHHALGSRLALVLPKGDLEHAVGFKPSRRLAVESGPLSLRFLLFDIYSGSRKRGPGAAADSGEPGRHL